MTGFAILLILSVCSRPLTVALAAGGGAAPQAARPAFSFVVVGTGQDECYDNEKEIPSPRAGQAFHGQDAQYRSNKPAYSDNGDGTLTDLNTGLTWQKADSGKGLNWEQALAYAENLKLAGHDDWRLPNAKELQSIVDYTRIPAIDPAFQISKLHDGEHPFFWSSTTHLDGPLDRICNFIRCVRGGAPAVTGSHP